MAKDSIYFTEKGASMLKDEDGLQRFMKGTVELGPWYPIAQFDAASIDVWIKKGYAVNV